MTLDDLKQIYLDAWTAADDDAISAGVRAVVEALRDEIVPPRMQVTDQRAIKLWQEATGKDHIWPDKAKTTLWLLERLEAAEAERDRLAGEVERLKEERDAAITDRFDAAAERIKAVTAERDRLAGEVEQACGREQRALLQRDCATKESEAWREERDRLKAALEPFAKLSTERQRCDPPEGTMRVRVVDVFEIEKARKALAGETT